MTISTLERLTAASETDPVASAALAGLAASPAVSLITADGTWTRPTPTVGVYTLALIELIGGGGGGGSGKRSTAGGGHETGGAGGMTGGLTQVIVPYSALPATMTATIGAGGAGGPAQTVNATDGVAGESGADTILTGTGFGLRANGGYGGLAGWNGHAINPGWPANRLAFGLPDSASQGRNVSSQTFAGDRQITGPHGGGGGVITSADVVSGGQTGWGLTFDTGVYPTAGVVDSTPPGEAPDPPAGVFVLGAAGAGGASSKTTDAQAGTDGGLYGGGGGGGGASHDNVGISGAGGNGAPGAIRIICY